METDDRRETRLTSLERLLLLIPLAGGAFFGLAPYLAPETFASLTGYSGQDAYIYRLAGSATFGYAVALGLGLRDGWWGPLRPIVIAVLVFNVVSILAGAIEVVRGQAKPVVFVIAAASILIIGVTAWLLARHGIQAGAARDVAGWTLWAVGLATAVAALFGTLPEFVGFFSNAFGYSGRDAYIFRQSGAATLGYAAMGLVELFAPRWREMRLPTVMALVFNGMAALASAFEATRGPVTPLVVVVLPASVLFTILFAAILARKGR
ncbi:MAG: hypothetical protein M3O91_04580 [Chloroflexota bacterium]|nr:hypothetical protein [Chloroflexota bacterium]